MHQLKILKGDWAIIEKIAKEIAKDDSVTSETEEVKVVIDGKKIHYQTRRYF